MDVAASLLPCERTSVGLLVLGRPSQRSPRIAWKQYCLSLDHANILCTLYSPSADYTASRTEGFRSYCGVLNSRTGKFDSKSIRCRSKLAARNSLHHVHGAQGSNRLKTTDWSRYFADSTSYNSTMKSSTAGRRHFGMALQMQGRLWRRASLTQWEGRLNTECKLQHRGSRRLARAIT